MSGLIGSGVCVWVRGTTEPESGDGINPDK